MLTGDDDCPTGTLSSDRFLPGYNDSGAVVTPSSALLAEFTAGPNPASKTDGAINFYWRGSHLGDGVLTIFDATGNIINKIEITDIGTPINYRRLVGSWNLRDAKNRQVSEGTYLVRGTVIIGGKIETVSLIISIVR